MRCGRANLPPILSQTVYHHISSPFSSKRLSLQENLRSSWTKHKTNRWKTPDHRMLLKKKHVFPGFFLKLRSFKPHGHHPRLGGFRRPWKEKDGPRWKGRFAENSWVFAGREKEWGWDCQQETRVNWNGIEYLPIATDGCVLMFSSHQQEVEIGFLELVGFHANHSNIL